MDSLSSSSLNAIVGFNQIMKISPNAAKALSPDERKAVMIALEAINKNEITNELAKPFVKAMITMEQFKKNGSKPDVPASTLGGSIKKWGQNQKGRISSKMIKAAAMSIEGQMETFEKAKAERLRKKEKTLKLVEAKLHGYQRIEEAGKICENLSPIIEQLNGKEVEDLFSFKQQIDNALNNLTELKRVVGENGEKFDQEKAVIQGSIDVLKELQKLPADIFEKDTFKSRGMRKLMKLSGNSKFDFIKEHSHLGQLQIYFDAAKKEHIGKVSDQEIQAEKLKVADLKHEIQILKGEIKPSR